MGEREQARGVAVKKIMSHLAKRGKVYLEENEVVIRMRDLGIL